MIPSLKEWDEKIETQDLLREFILYKLFPLTLSLSLSLTLSVSLFSVSLSLLSLSLSLLSLSLLSLSLLYFLYFSHSYSAITHYKFNRSQTHHTTQTHSSSELGQLRQK